MNYKITHNWLLDYIETDATPEEIQDYLSLSAVNVETLEKVGDDTVYDIEITSNRIDAASVIGFARECVAVLPQHGKKATLKNDPLEKSLEDIQEGSEHELKINIKDTDTISRITAVILSHTQVGASPDIIKTRLEACGERSINNVVDISNYLRITLGQPVHTFDYDQIKGASMSIEKSSKGDVVTLIDGKELTLPGNDVIIRDGEGRIIDLVGLMGGQNTGVTDDTENVLLFIPIVDKTLVRRTSMSTGHRTPAISYFEKGLDEEMTEPTCALGVELLQKYASAAVASKVYDIYPEPSEDVTIEVSLAYLNTLMDTDIKAEKVKDMISPLGFETQIDGDKLMVSVPSWRRKDVDSAADILEEVARIYGYHNINSHIQKTGVVYQPLEVYQLTEAKETVRNYLASVGFNEQYNYSMISEDMIKAYKHDPSNYLKLADTISQDIEYMRTNLIPSLLKNIADNQGYRDSLRFFELARVYKKRENALPVEDERLSLVAHMTFSELKGVVENILDLLNIEGVRFTEYGDAAESGTQAQLVHTDGGDTNLGHIGLLKASYMMSHGIGKQVCVAEIRFGDLIKHINPHPKYTKPNPHAHIKLDLTYTSTPEKNFSDIKAQAFTSCQLLRNIELIDTYEDKVTLRFTFAAEDRNITEDEAKGELEKIKQSFS